MTALRQDWPRIAIMTLAVATVAWLVLYPLEQLVAVALHDKQGGTALANLLRVVTDPSLGQALVNSIVVSIGTTASSLALALPMAWGVSRLALPGRQLVRMLVMVAFVVPNFIGAVAWILLLGPNAGMLNVWLRDLTGSDIGFDIFSLPGLVLVLTLSFYPLVFFAVSSALDNMDPGYEEAAQMSGASPIRGALGITLPLVLPAIVSSSVVVFLEAMGAFGAPAAIANAAQFHTLTTKIYELFSYPPRFELAAAAATPIVVFTLLGMWAQRLALGGRRRYAVVSGKATAARAVAAGWWRWAVTGYSAFVLLIGVVLPVLVLVRTSLLARWGREFSWQNLTLFNYAIFADDTTFVPIATVNSIVVAAATACACLVLAMVVVWMVERTSMPGRGLLTTLSTFTLAFPGVALAVGFVLGYNAAPLALYGTIWLFIVAFTAQRFPFAFIFLRSAMKQLSPELEEAARTVGASWLRATLTIAVPLLKTGLVVAWIMVFAVSLRELSMAILLYVRGTETLPVAIFSFMDDGTFETAASLSVVLVAISILSVALLRRLTGRATMEI